MRTRLLTALFVLLGTLAGSYAQVCNTTARLPDTVVLSIEGTTCIQCVLAGAVQTSVQWFIAGSPTPLTGSANSASVENGLLVITDAQAFVDGNGGTPPISVRCAGGLGDDTENVYIEGFFDPIVSPPSTTVTEGEDLEAFCTSINAPGSVQQEWLDPMGNTIPDQFIVLNVPGLSRSQAGTYTCRFTLLADNSMTKTATVEVTVNYPPGIVSGSTDTGLVPLNGMFSLECTWDSVPDSTVTWFHNNVELMDGDANVDVVNNGRTSTLTISPVGRNDGGDYVCRADNGIGSPAEDLVMRTVQVEPSPATALVASNIQERSFDLSWTNGFDGLSEITGVTIDLEVSGINVGIISLGNVESTSVENLDPFTEYTIILRVVNAIGPSSQISTTAMTLSLFLGAPINVMLTSPTSESLLLDWDPPVPVIATTSPPTNWSAELFSADGVSLGTNSIADPATTEFLFMSLDKGVNYSARVAGYNVRGMGNYSVTVSAQTLVDPPSMPLSLGGMGVSAFGFTLSWSLPADNGGRPVTGYEVTYTRDVTGENGMVSVDGTALLLRNGGDPMPSLQLENSTTYSIEVRAVNEAGPGAPATISVTTQSIDDPQPIFEEPESAAITNLTATVSWMHPGGTVNMFEIEYKLSLDVWGTADVETITVPGTETSVVLTDLVPEADYDVRVRSMNDNGVSVFSLEVSFTTLMADAPLVEGPVRVSAGTRTQINCTSALNIPERPLEWQREITENGNIVTVDIAQCGCNANPQGNLDLVFDNPASTDSGVYICSIGSSRTRHTITFTEPPPTQGISMEVIIIVAVIGGVALLVFLVVLVLACYCTCCSGKSTRSKGYNVKSSKPKKAKDKRSKAGRSRNNWIETSTKFVPNTTPSYARTADEPSPFDMPEDLTTHSSFNTLEKQNRVRRSESPGNPYGSSNV